MVQASFALRQFRAVTSGKSARCRLETRSLSRRMTLDEGTVLAHFLGLYRLNLPLPSHVCSCRGRPENVRHPPFSYRHERTNSVALSEAFSGGLNSRNRHRNFSKVRNSVCITTWVGGPSGIQRKTQLSFCVSHGFIRRLHLDPHQRVPSL